MRRRSRPPIAEEENEISENARAPDALVLRDGHDYLLLVGEDVIGKSDRPLNGGIAFMIDMTLRSRHGLEHTAADAQPSGGGPVSGHPSTGDEHSFDLGHGGALAFYISCDRDGRDAYDGLAGGGVTFHLGDVAQELTVGYGQHRQTESLSSSPIPSATSRIFRTAGSLS